jgi:hypothetical protein
MNNSISKAGYAGLGHCSVCGLWTILYDYPDVSSDGVNVLASEILALIRLQQQPPEYGLYLRPFRLTGSLVVEIPVPIYGSPGAWSPPFTFHLSPFSPWRLGGLA